MDAYNKLRPWTEIDACECASVGGLFLVDLLTDNPVHCDSCRKEVDPERLKLTAEETEAVARWFSAAGALYRLWLDSGEYEEYAKARLLDPDGQVNRDGLEVARTLSARVPTRLWFFHDADDGEPTHCPFCRGELDTDVKWGTGRCPKCPVHL
jgi:muconolactone delta-isomerase